MNLSEFLTKARKRLGLSQEKAADKLGVAVATVKGWEDGAVPKKNIVDAIIDIYQVKRKDLRKYIGEELVPVKEKEDCPWNENGVFNQLDANGIELYLKDEYDISLTLNEKMLLTYAMYMLKIECGKCTLDGLFMVFEDKKSGIILLKRLADEKLEVEFQQDIFDRYVRTISSWMITDYYTGLGGGRVATYTYHNCFTLREFVAKLNYENFENQDFDRTISSEYRKLKESEQI